MKGKIIIIKKRAMLLLAAIVYTSEIQAAAQRSVPRDVRSLLNSKLINAIKICDTQEATDLLAAGADVNAVDIPPEKKSALMVAATAGCLEIIDLLIEKGANVNALDADNRNALQATVTFQKKPEQAPAIVNRLIKAGIDVNNIEAGTFWASPLFNLVQSNESSYTAKIIDNIYALPIAFQLLMAGADKNFVSWSEETPLMLATRLGNHDMAALLEMYPGRNLHELIIFSIAKMFYSDDPQVRAAGEKQLEQLQETAFADQNPNLMRMLYLIIGKGAACTRRTLKKR